MSKVSTAKVSRRRFMIAGAGSAGAAAAVAAALPLTQSETSSAAPAKPAAPDQGGGYQVTEHVLTYYRTARV